MQSGPSLLAPIHSKVALFFIASFFLNHVTWHQGLLLHISSHHIMQISDCYSRRGAKKIPLAKHHHCLVPEVLQLKERKKHGKRRGKKIPVKYQKPQNENVWKTQQAEKRIGSRIGKPFAWMSPKPQTLA